MTAGDFNRDSFADLTAGAPEENLADLLGAGAVSILYGSAGGITTPGGQLFTQDSPGIPGISESLDGFGSALTTGGLGAAPAAASPSGSVPQPGSQRWTTKPTSRAVGAGGATARGPESRPGSASAWICPAVAGPTTLGRDPAHAGVEGSRAAEAPSGRGRRGPASVSPDP